MRLLLLFSALFLPALFIFAQNSNTQSELKQSKLSKAKYIEVNIEVFPATGFRSSRLTTPRSISWHSDTVKNEYYDEYVALKKAMTLNSVIEVINKFSESGWQLVTSQVQPINSSLGTFEAIYYFKKEY